MWTCSDLRLWAACKSCCYSCACHLHPSAAFAACEACLCMSFPSFLLVEIWMGERSTATGLVLLACGAEGDWMIRSGKTALARASLRLIILAAGFALVFFACSRVVSLWNKAAHWLCILHANLSIKNRRGSRAISVSPPVRGLVPSSIAEYNKCLRDSKPAIVLLEVSICGGDPTSGPSLNSKIRNRGTKVMSVLLSTLSTNNSEQSSHTEFTVVAVLPGRRRPMGD